MIITVFTDAGYCNRMRGGSFAVWAKANGATFRKAGILKGEISHSHVAELRAIANGVHCAINYFKPAKGARIILQTDCKSMIDALLGTGHKKPGARRIIQSEVSLIQKYIGESGVSIEYRHVYGHQGTKTKRSSVNTWCDDQCKIYLRQARQIAGIPQREPKA